MWNITTVRRISTTKIKYFTTKPTSSEVLTCYLKQCNEPPWTSYFVKYSNINDDQWGKSHFNWKVGSSNYHILRTGCYPYIKYHCSKRNPQNLIIEDYFFRFIKVLNLGIPCLAYGLAASFLIKHEETVKTPKDLAVKSIMATPLESTSSEAETGLFLLKFEFSKIARLHLP